LGTSSGGLVLACKTQKRAARARFWSGVRKSKRRPKGRYVGGLCVAIAMTAHCVGEIAGGADLGLQNENRARTGSISAGG
jgi:hypothetical protein